MPVLASDVVASAFTVTVHLICRWRSAMECTVIAIAVLPCVQMIDVMDVLFTSFGIEYRSIDIAPFP
jgi:hypothetical protein